MFNKTKLLFLGILFILSGCEESASSKINKEITQNSNIQTLYPEITFDKIVHDFGNVNEGDIVKTVFNFTNTGENDLYIVDAVASCGCTVPKYPKNIAIPPGDNGEIEVNFNTSGRPNLQSKLVRISANTKSGSSFLTIKAFVQPKNN